MLARQRQVRILEEIRRAGGARVSDLVDLLGVSDMTIRRDVVDTLPESVRRRPRTSTGRDRNRQGQQCDELFRHPPFIIAEPARLTRQLSD